uniref:SET domain-containing protein n=1 Tax=Macrostomum lignano TaxID=282301 RepID=A0A1I8FR09_9PLAT
ERRKQQQQKALAEARVAFDLFLAGLEAASHDGPCLGTRQTASAPFVYSTMGEHPNLWLFQSVMSVRPVSQETGTAAAACITLPHSASSMRRTPAGCPGACCYSSGLVIVPLYDTLAGRPASHILQSIPRPVPPATKPASFCRLPGRRRRSSAWRFCRARTSKAATVSELGSAEQAIRLIVRRASEAEQPAGAALSATLMRFAKGRERREQKENSGDGQQQEDAGRQQEAAAQRLGCDLPTPCGTTAPGGVEQLDRYFSLTSMAHILERNVPVCSPSPTACPWDSFAAIGPASMDDTARVGVGQRLKSPSLTRRCPRKSRRLSQLRVDKDTLWDRLVFRRVQEGLWAAARAAGCPVVQVSARRKPAASACASGPANPASNHTGRPMLGIEVRLADVPDATVRMRRLDGRGEFRSARPRLLTSDGCVHTATSPSCSPAAPNRIVDRVKHLFKLAQGEYIAPEKIELVYCLNPAIDQVFVDGRSERSCLLGVVVANVGRRQGLAGQESADTAAAAGDSPPELLAAACGSAGFKAHLLGELQQLGKQKGCRASSSAENDLMTPTMKLKRPQLRKRFADAFDAMYAEVEPLAAH